jgi:hypothetical protein
MTFMSGRRFSRNTLVTVLAMSVVWIGSATAQASAKQSTVSVKRYGVTAVTRAFRASGIGLYDTGYGAVQPVKAFASTQSHQGWNVAVYIYLTPLAATESYNGSVKAWHNAGMAAAVKKNIVVAVVPKNRLTIGKSAKPFPMPELVAKTLASLPG